MDNQPVDFSGNVERFSGFADLYDKFRPAPPAILASILTHLAQTPYPKLVVDLGSGTGLSTRYWADKAEQVIGVEPTLDMRRQAEVQTETANVSYQEGYSHQTNLPDHCAQIVTCSQSLHWMEPQSTFEEARRIIVPGGSSRRTIMIGRPLPATGGQIWRIENPSRKLQKPIRILKTKHRLLNGRSMSIFLECGIVAAFVSQKKSSCTTSNRAMHND